MSLQHHTLTHAPPRRAGQPLLAACAALSVNDVVGAIEALHLGHEPEQAAMLALAFRGAVNVPKQLQDRVLLALSASCEAAGDWDAAAAALHLLSHDSEQALQLLVVRSEATAKQRAGRTQCQTPMTTPQTSSSVGSDSARLAITVQTAAGLRARLGLQPPATYAAALSIEACNSIQAAHMALLSGDHACAASILLTQLPTLLDALQREIVMDCTHVHVNSSSCEQDRDSSLPPPLLPLAPMLQHTAVAGASAADRIASGNASCTTTLHCVPGPLHGCSAVSELLAWQHLVASLDAAALSRESWLPVHATALLSGALRAFCWGYTQVGLLWQEVGVGVVWADDVGMHAMWPFGKTSMMIHKG